MSDIKKIKRMVLREEYYKLLHDPFLAIILNQFVYLEFRTKEADKFIEEEIERMKNNGTLTNFESSKGWIYKSAKELNEETMLNISEKTIRRYVGELVKMGILSERENPKYKWDKTKQYKVNFKRLESLLRGIGYSLETALEGKYKLIGKKIYEAVDSPDRNAMVSDRSVKFSTGSGKMPDRSVKMPDRDGAGDGAIPKTTSKTTPETTRKEKKKKEKRSFVSNENPFDTTANSEEKDIANTKGQSVGNKTKDWSGTQEYEIAQWFKSTLSERLQRDVNKSRLNKWAKTLNDCTRLDGYSLERVREILEWARADEFWHKNVLSIDKLRRRSKNVGYRFLDLLAEKMEEQRGARGGKKSILDIKLDDN